MVDFVKNRSYLGPSRMYSASEFPWGVRENLSGYSLAESRPVTTVIIMIVCVEVNFINHLRIKDNNIQL